MLSVQQPGYPVFPIPPFSNTPQKAQAVIFLAFVVLEPSVPVVRLQGVLFAG